MKGVLDLCKDGKQDKESMYVFQANLYPLSAVGLYRPVGVPDAKKKKPSKKGTKSGKEAKKKGARDEGQQKEGDVDEFFDLDDLDEE